MDMEANRELVAHAVRALEGRLSQLVDALSHDAVWAELEKKGSARSVIRRACEAIAAIDYAIDYAMDDPTNQSVVCLGVIGISPDIMKLVHVVNAAKLELKSVCSPLQNVRIRVPVKGSSGPTKAIPAIRVLLRSIQRSDLNLLAAYRKIPVLDALPSTITYTVARTRAVYRKTVEQVSDLVANRDHPRAAIDQQRLASLDRQETHLALARDRYVNIRANVRYARLDPRGRGRAQFAAELPLMFVKRRRDTPPVIAFPNAASATKRTRRSLLEGAPFLESLPIYRYLSD